MIHRFCRRCLVFALVLSPFIYTVACGSGSTQSTPPAPDFALSVSPSSLTVTAGTSSTFQVSLQAEHGFTESASVQVSNLPAGVTLTPVGSFSVSAPSPQTVTVNVASTVAAGTYSTQITATSGPLSHTAAESITVKAPVNPDFTLTLTPSSLSMTPGAQASFQIALQPSRGFSSLAQVQISNLPSGMTASPAGAFNITSSTPQTVSVATMSTLAAGSYSLTITATSGSLSHSVTESVTVTPSGPPPPSRADFVRTDDTPAAAVYDQTHHRVYETNPVAGTVDVIDSTTYQILRRIPVSSPAGVDITPDDSIVFIGTNSQILYALDTTSLAMTAQLVVPLYQSGPEFGDPWFSQSPQAPIAEPDDTAVISLYNQTEKWNPVTGQVTIVVPSPPTKFPFGVGEGVLSRSANHSSVIMSNDDDDSTVYLYDTATNTFSSPLTVKGSAYAVAASPDGKNFVIAAALDTGQEVLMLLDANLNTRLTIPGGGTPIYSADGNSVYLVCGYGLNGLPAVAILNSQTLQLVGVAPSYATNIAYFERVPPLIQESPLTVDETGRIFGSADHGLAIDDATDIRPYTGKEVFPIYDIIADPDDGPVDQEQQIQIMTESYPAAPSIWFGSQAAFGTVQTPTYLTTTTPAIPQVGPVNVRVDGADLVQAWVPQAYTYGVALTPGPDLAGPSTGGSTVHIFGYGLSSEDTGTGETISFGNVSAAVSGHILYPGEEEYPFPLWDLKVTTPATTPGESAITVTAQWGSSTQPNAYHALNVSSYPLDSTPYSLAFDPTRNRIYIAVATHIDVFSLSTSAYLSTIQIPTLNNTTQLGSLALTPDGKWLIAANWDDGSVAVIDPDNPSSATAVAVGIPPSQSIWEQGPNQLGVTNTGLVFVGVGGPPDTIVQTVAASRRKLPAPATSSTPTGPGANVWQLNLSTLQAQPFAPLATSIVAAPLIASSFDGSEVCLTGEYLPLTVYQSSTEELSTGQGLAGPDACAVNGPIVAGAGTGMAVAQMYNLSATGTAFASLTDFQATWLVSYAGGNFGVATDSTGALIYVPTAPQSVAIFDSHTGEVREIVSFAQPLNDLQESGSIVIDPEGDRIFVTTPAGLTIVQMDSLPLAIGSVTVAGSSWAIAGTGFVPGTTVVADGIPLSVEFTDPQHIQVSGAPALNSTHFVTLTNPDGHTYTYDDAYLQ